MAQQSSYGAIPSTDVDAPLVPVDAESSTFVKSRHEIGELLESKKSHVLILILTVLDLLLVIFQIGASLLGLDDSEEAEWILEVFAHASLAIVSVFVVEIFFKVYAFGFSYFWSSNPHGYLHLADAAIIVISFLLEVFLKGAEQELGSLLIIFRLWRLIKLTGTVAIETAEHQQEQLERLEDQIKELQQQLDESRAEVAQLRAHTADQV
ncbi:voltage-gated hydrogen channel 1 [Entomortierella parvispora]|uniref:Voltage-gated hydrogen channel 1 n=1 Tax=Entomortierella parvispora TaxID=205924 RepID=A0A9P3LVQ0_9FUNG|nr:voltage-gated hydrogen channel 1 [Entomortierella parvispora]